jgi:hypothetical protein
MDARHDANAGAVGFQVLSLSDFDPRVRDYKKRKAHKKTKAGCLACKAKKVKVCPFIPRKKPWCLTNGGADAHASATS